MATKKVKKSAAKTAHKTTKKVVEEAKAAVVAVEAATVKVKETVKEAVAKVTGKRITEQELLRLRKMNLWLALAFGVQAIAVVLFGGSKAASVTMEYLAPDQLSSAVNGHQVLGLASRHIAHVRFTAVAAGFLVLFGITCLIMALGSGRAQ